ncbi:Dps family protein [Flavobacterium croceum]|uniref:Dps family protein n=1 Tax=Flavobacterium croceum TaxID=370975 RepID=UPI0024A816FF|nr:Dps family protein [Flavobacterium croceum]
MNAIGLPQEQATILANSLNNLLANFQIYYQNLRGLHWNIKGRRFFELHVKFEELYTDAQLKIDMIAERILTLGETPFHTFESYLSKNTLPIGENVFEDEDAVKLILQCLQRLLILERQTIKLASEIDDEGTTTLVSDLISKQEKNIWMFHAWIA